MIFIQIEEIIREDKKDNSSNEMFKKLTNKKLKTYFNTLFDNVFDETSKIHLYFEDKLKTFPSLFDSNLKDMTETINYLEKIAIPSNTECTEIIDNIPCWRCLDCTEYNSIYCSNCYIKSKNLHKEHRVHFLPKIGGMCDCGEPNTFKIFCPEHKGPFTEQKQIDEFINKSFSQEILGKLIYFFDDLFLQFSKYLVLTEQCTFFCKEIFSKNIHNVREKDDVFTLKENFGIVFQNFLTFLYVITNKNMGMLYLITKYIIKNHLASDNNIDEKFKTSHSCIILENKNIQIKYRNENYNKDIFSFKEENPKDKHICECSFLRLLLTNWRDILQSKEEVMNKQLFFSFFHNCFLREIYSLLYFFIFKEILLNYNKDIISQRIQFSSEDNILLIGNQTDILENTFNIFDEYLKELLNNPISNDDKDNSNADILEKIILMANDCINFVKQKEKKIINSKIILLKKFVDTTCIIHNQCKYESIFPHPEFQDKKCSINLINVELLLIKIASRLNLCYDWEDKEKTKDFFDYIINKILNQNIEKIQCLKENEYSFHLSLYRTFSIFLNYFCFNYILKNNKNMTDAIDYIKNVLFKSKEEMQKVIDIIINDYFKMLGFLIGIKNEYFNYYDSLYYYDKIYFNNLEYLKIDFTLIKYLLAMSEQKLNLDNMLKVSNIENIYSFFNRIFKEKKFDKNEINKDEKQHIMHWVRFFEIIIDIMKNDSSHFHNILTYYNEIICLKTKTELFNNIKKNENLMNDIRNNLREKFILIFIGSGNLLDMKTIKRLVNGYYFNIFNDKEFNSILNELTENKIYDKKIIYSIKDSCLKYLDFDYFFSPFIKSQAELYINDFKKDKFKSFNSYYFKPSIIMFDFYNKVYENTLLNIDNIEFVLNIIEILLCQNENDSKYLDPIKNEILPLTLNFMTMIGTINSKLFFKFKIENKILFDKIFNILNTAIKNNKKTSILDKDLYENIINTITKLNTFKIIYENIKEDINNLNDNDYNNDNNLLIENEKNISISLNNNENQNEDNSQDNAKRKKNKDMKEKYKNLIKQKRNKFMDKIKTDKRMTNIIENGEHKNEEEEKDKIMCFFCRNDIILNSFKEPYGKMGNICIDYFYKNSFRSSIRAELKKITKNIEEKNQIYSNIKENNRDEDLSIRIISCGHYFHQKCFKEKLNEIGTIKCPLCEKTGNSLIPPLTNFHRKDIFLQSEKLTKILDKKYEFKKTEIIKENIIFKEIGLSFLQSNVKKNIINNDTIKDYNSFINEIFKSYEYNLNYLINLFYCEATTFYKQQQIDSIQNFLLLIRYLIKIDFIDISQIINFIRNGVDNIINGPNENDNIMDKYKKMYYSKEIDKIIFLFVILLDYDEIQKLYLYIFNWTLPYFSFWLYLRNIIIENNYYSFYDDKTKEKINVNYLLQYLNNNYVQINHYIKLFLQKLLLIKIITKYDDKKEDIIKNININNLTIENLFTELNIENIYQLLSKDLINEINIIDVMEKMVKILSNDNSFINKDYIILDYNKIYNLFINNLLKTKEEKYLMNAELFYQFVIYKFELIDLEYNVFDFIEKNLFKKCHICQKLKKNNCVCLICGNKICLEDIINHVFKCTFSDIINIEMQTMKVFSFYDYKEFKSLYYLYTNEYNEGPDTKFISNEYNLNKDRIKLILKSFVCIDYH